MLYIYIKLFCHKFIISLDKRLFTNHKIVSLYYIYEHLKMDTLHSFLIVSYGFKADKSMQNWSPLVPIYIPLTARVSFNLRILYLKTALILYVTLIYGYTYIWR